MRLIPGLLSALALVVAASAADAAELYALVADSQEIQGDAIAGEPIRIEFPLAAGSEPRIRLALIGSLANQPISFSEARLIGPDGQEIFLPPGEFFRETHTLGRDTIALSNWVAQTSGRHQLYIHTNARLTTRVKGKIKIARPKKFKLVGDENSPPIAVSLAERDSTRLTVTRVSGTAPKIASFRKPTGVTTTPGQQINAKGSKSVALSAELLSGVFEYAIGYQAEPAAGQWRATLRITPFKGGFPATLVLRNSPGVPLSVRTADRLLLPTFATTAVGVASDGLNVMVTGEQAGVLSGQVFDRDLQQSPILPNPFALTTATDFSPTETLSGHRVMYMGTFYYVAFSTTSGKELSLTRVRTDLVRDGFTQVVSASADPTADFFLTGNGPQVSVGVFHPPDGHTVHLLSATDFGIRSTVSIGGAQFPQMNGSGAAWRASDSVFELWSPTTLAYQGPSDLHRVLYNAAWSPTTTDAKPVDEIGVTETMPTAVTIDPQSKATILHYVVPQNPPVSGATTGYGRIHRRVFDESGVEVPDSHTILPRTLCNRPVSTLLGNSVYLAYQTDTGTVVERYPLLR
jgi:hypothetical protein